MSSHDRFSQDAPGPKGRPLWVGLLGLLLLCTVGLGSALAEAQSLERLAESGRFNQVLKALEHEDLPQTPALKRLQQSLQEHLQHRGQQIEQRRQAFEKALDEVAQALEQEDQQKAISSALNKALLARSLSDEPQSVLERPAVKRLVRRTLAAVDKAKQRGDWLEVVNLYRTLDTLHEETGQYHQNVLEAQRRLQLLRTYVPQRLEQLLRERAAKQGGDEEELDQSIRVDVEPWQETLEGTNRLTLSWALQRTALEHVSRPEVSPLMQGATEAVRRLISMPELAKPFPSLKQEQKVQEFDRRLAEATEQVDPQIGDWLDQFMSLSAQRGGGRDQQLRRVYVNIINEIDQWTDRVLLANLETVELPEYVVLYEMTNGVLSVTDEFSAVIWPKEVERFSDSTKGKFTGVGIQISLSPRDGRITVVSPLPDTPAYRAHIKPGDVIVSVDGQKTEGWGLDRVVDEIRGPEGTQVVLGIERVGLDEPMQVPLKRAQIIIESVRGWKRQDTGWDYLIDPNQRIAYVRISQFIPQTVDHLDEALAQAERNGPINGLILDLRFNPGGLLSSAVDMTDRFLPAGEIVRTVDARGRTEGQIPMAKQHGTYPDFPLVILINQGSASASEIVSGALQAHDRAVVVGTRSFGKGSVQKIFPIDGVRNPRQLRGRTLLKLTNQYYKLPDGRIIHRKPGKDQWGIQPDVTVKVTGDQIETLFEVRREADVLREPTDDTPEAQDAPQDAQHNAQQDDQSGPDQPQGVQRILREGLDPQLSAALLILRTSHVAQGLSEELQHRITRGQQREPLEMGTP